MQNPDKHDVDYFAEIKEETHVEGENMRDVWGAIKPLISPTIVLTMQLALFAAVFLNIAVARQIIGILYLTFLPGFVILKLLNVDELDMIGRALFSIGFSIAFLMLLGLFVNEFGPFAGTESLLMKLAKKGKNRQKMHGRLRELSLKAWDSILSGTENPLIEMIKQDRIIGKMLSSEEIEDLLSPTTYIGDAPERCELFIERILEPVLDKYKHKVGKEEEATF